MNKLIVLEHNGITITPHFDLEGRGQLAYITISKSGNRIHISSDDILEFANMLNEATRIYNFEENQDVKN